MSKIDLTKPSRQSIKGLVFIFIQGLGVSIRTFWPIMLVVVFQNKIFENTLVLGLIGIVIFLLLIAHSILYYLNFYFYVSGGEFILKKGYLEKKILTIPLERIQSVNTKQNLIQQLLNVLTLEIDTAGAASNELKIHALEKSFAIELQNLIRSGKEINVAFKTNGEEEVKEEAETLVLRLTPADLLKIGISQNHFRAGLIILAFGVQIYQKAQDIFEEKANEYSGDFVNLMSNSSWALITFLVILFLMISVLFSLSRTVFKYYDFKLLKKNETYRIESGLVNKRNVIIPYNKVQELNWETGPVKQLFGIYHLVIKQAVSGQDKRVQLADAPGCLANHLELLKTDLFGNDELSGISKNYSNPYYFRRLWIFWGWLPVILSSPFFYDVWSFWLAACLWLGTAAGYSFLVLKKRYFRMNNNQIRISKGAISHQWKQMELYKIQSVEFRQSVFQRRRSLASLRLTNASGSMTIPYIEESMAKQIYNYLLYHTETSIKSWM